MIQHPNKIFFSRWEEKTEENKWLYTSAYTLASAGKKLYFKTFSEENKEWWAKWNVIELHGHKSPKLHFVEYEHFGIHPYPKELRRIVFYPNKEIVELKILDPFILHQSFNLVPVSGLGEKDPLKNPKDRKRWFEKCDLLYRDFEDQNLIDHPQAHYLSGWNELLSIKGLEVVNLPTKDKPFSIDNWKVQPIEIHAECSFGDL